MKPGLFDALPLTAARSTRQVILRTVLLCPVVNQWETAGLGHASFFLCSWARLCNCYGTPITRSPPAARNAACVSLRRCSTSFISSTKRGDGAQGREPWIERNGGGAEESAIDAGFPQKQRARKPARASQEKRRTPVLPIQAAGTAVTGRSAALFFGQSEARSKRPRFITLSHAATKSFTNFSLESAEA